jgi:acetylornithine deacetylase/succinyl-diaminopimelate desuccinylase-like protein
LLGTFVGVPTVSADPAHAGDIERGCELAVETIRGFGGRPEVYRPRQGNPVVHGVFDQSPSLPTVTVYNHLDVQPASRDDGVWRTDPFVMVREGDRYFGRGTTDDKGPALSALFGIRAARESGLPINLRVLWELEEEVGSPGLDEVLRGAGRKLRTDSILVSDTVWLTRTQPACPTSLRGFQGFRFELRTAEGDRHSGDVGGPGRNAIAELMGLVCKIHDPDTGRVKIPGFYADVVAPTRRELEEFRRSGFSLRAYKRDFRLRSLRTDDPLEVMKRMWALPTFEVHGVAGGYAGPGLKSIVPGRAEVFASCRLVANQTPEKIRRLVTSFVKKHAPDVKVHAEGGSLPYRGLTTGPLADAIREAVRFGFGRPPVFVRDGGTIGAVVTMEKVLRCPVLFLGISLPEHGYHAPNENFDWGQASRGMAAFARYFERVAAMGPPRAVD